MTPSAVRRLVNQMKMPEKVTWPQKPLQHSFPYPPVDQAETTARMRVIEQIAELERLSTVALASRRLMVERLNQVPDWN